MRTYEAVRADQTRGVDQAIENAERDLDTTRKTLASRQQERRSVDTELQACTLQHRALDSPQSALKAEIADIERRLADLQRQAEAKKDQLREVEAQAEQLRQEVARQRTSGSSIDREIARVAEDVRAKATALEAARKRRGEALAQALRLYVVEVFDFMETYATRATAREVHDQAKAKFEEARHSDLSILEAHEQRIELKRFLESTQVPANRRTLEDQLRLVERFLTERFPGSLDPPPPGEDQEPIETYFWRDEEDDLTYLLLLVPGSCWHTPPDRAEDPRGRRTAQLLWGFVQALGEPVPSVEILHDLVVLELLGDHTNRLGEKFIEIPVAVGRTVAFLPTPLPADLREALA